MAEHDLTQFGYCTVGVVVKVLLSPERSTRVRVLVRSINLLENVVNQLSSQVH